VNAYIRRNADIIAIALGAVAFITITIALSVQSERKTTELKRRLNVQTQEWEDLKKRIRADIGEREGDRSYRVVTQHLQELGL
jgi:hypothetical protein